MTLRLSLLSATLLAAGSLSAGCATHVIYGKVVDRNGEPMERAIISLSPGNVQLVTDQEGNFQIDYLRDEAGERTKLSKKADYSIEIFQVGYHVSNTSLFYKRGEMPLDPIVLKEDSIRVVGSDSDIDPGQYSDRTHSAGATYEGE